MERLRPFVGEFDQPLLNRSIAARIDSAIKRDHTISGMAIARKNLDPLYADVPIEEIERIVALRAKTEGMELYGEHKNGEGLKVLLGSYKTSEWFQGWLSAPSLMPPLEIASRKFAKPVYVLDVGDDKNDFLQTSPHGLIAGVVIDGNNRVFTVRNIYTFDDMGEGAKFELIREISDEGDDPVDFCLEAFNFKDEQIKRTNHIMSEEDSRALLLDEADYEFVTNVLTLIEAGEFNARDSEFNIADIN